MEQKENNKNCSNWIFIVSLGIFCLYILWMLFMKCSFCVWRWLFVKQSFSVRDNEESQVAKGNQWKFRSNFQFLLWITLDSESSNQMTWMCFMNSQLYMQFYHRVTWKRRKTVSSGIKHDDACERWESRSNREKSRENFFHSLGKLLSAIFNSPLHVETVGFSRTQSCCVTISHR